MMFAHEHFSVLHVGPRQEDSPLSPVSYQMHPSYPSVPSQVIIIRRGMKRGGASETQNV